MRTGAIFARGSCRALKWMALFGVVFALGAGQAAAQATVALEGTKTLAEGGALVPVTAVVTVPAGTEASNNFEVTLTISVDADTADPVQERAEIARADADIYWEGTTRGAPAYVFPDGTFRWALNETAVQTFRATVRMGTFRDTDAENEKFVVTPTLGTATAYMVDDAETQEYLLTHPLSNDNVIKEGANPVLRLEAKPPISGDVVFRVNLSSTNDSNDYWLSTVTERPASTAISEHFTLDGADDGDSMVDVFLNTSINDVDRIDDTITLVALTTVATTGTPIGTQVAELDLAVVDQHKLPSVAIDGVTIKVGTTNTPVSPALTLVEGQLGTLKLVADRGTTTDDVYDNEAVTVTLSLEASSTASAQDYRLAGSPVSIAAAAGKGGSGTFTLDVLPDEDVGSEILTLTATVAGEAAYGTATKDVELADIALGDTTTKKIYPLPVDVAYPAIMKAREEGAGANGLWTPGEMMTLEAADLFGWPTTTTSVVLGNIVIEDTNVVSAVTSNTSLVITAVGDGMTEISVTATVVTESSSFMPSQTVSNVATVKFPLTVDVPMIIAKDNAQSVADAAVAAAGMASANGIWEPAPNGVAAMIALSDLFDVPDSITPRYLSESSTDMAGTRVSGANVEVTPMAAGMAMITVTAVDTDRPGNAVSVDFNVTVMEQAVVRALSQAEVDAVFETAGADDLVAQGPSIRLDASELFEVGPGVTPSYASMSSDAVLTASVTGTTLTLTPSQGVAGGMSTITVTALDTASDANVSVTYMATVDALAPVLTITSMPMSGGSVMEGGEITMTATLNQPALGAMTVALDVSGPASGATEIMLAAGSMSAFATLAVTNDEVVMAMPAIVIVASHEAIAGGSDVLNFSVTEDDVETTYSVTPSVSVTEGGEGATITATASQAVLADTEVMLMHGAGNATGPPDGDYELAPVLITIMADGTTGSTVLTATDDYDVEGMEMVTLNAMIGTMSVGTVEVTIVDDDMETTYELTASAEMAEEGGAAVTITATADQTVREDTMVQLTAVGGSADGDDYSLDPMMITIESGMASGSAMLTATDDTDVEGVETLRLQGAIGSMIVGEVLLEIGDNDMEITYSVTPTAVSVTEGGEGAAITATASQAVLANTEVMLMHGAGNATAPPDGDYELAPVLITIMAGETIGSTMLTATDDYDVEGMEMVTLNAMIGTMSVGTVEVTIVDDDMETTYELTASAEMAEEGGAAVTITATANQTVREDTMVQLTAIGGSADGDDYSLDPMMITIESGMASGSAMLTATDDTDVEGVETLRLQGAIGSMIVGEVLLEIGDNDMEITYGLVPLTDMNLVEGMSYELTATADPAVQVDTEVMLMLDRPTSDADETDYTVEPIMIMAGETSGTTMLMVTEDSMEDSGRDSPEMLTLYGMVGNMSTNSVSFYLWDAAVPVLPFIAQLLLAAFLAIGGYRRYLRR